MARNEQIGRQRRHLGCDPIHDAPGKCCPQARRPAEQRGRLLHYCVWFGFLVITLAGQGQTNSAPQDPKSLPRNEASESTSVELRGRVVCLPEEMHRFYQADLPTGHDHIYGFRTSDGKYYTILRTKYSEALFADERFRQKELLLKGRIFPRTQIFEPMTIRSIKDGVVQDIFYYCSVCDIETVAPGPCECCQGPTELVEKPLPKKP